MCSWGRLVSMQDGRNEMNDVIVSTFILVVGILVIVVFICMKVFDD